MTSGASGPHRGEPTSSSFVSKSRLEGFHHVPLCGLVASRPGFPTSDYQERRLKPLGLNLIRGGGGNSSCLVL
jgi:hypothetical protein